MGLPVLKPRKVQMLTQVVAVVHQTCTGESDQVFRSVINKIEQKILALRDALSKQ